MEVAFIFPHQLFEHHPALAKERHIFLMEHPRFFTDFTFHKQKILLHRASMKWYYDYLRSKKYRVEYIEWADVKSHLHKIGLKKETRVYYADVVHHKLDQELKKQFGSRAIVVESPSFLSSTDWLKKTLGDKDHYLMNSFYIEQRKQLDILITQGKPTGAKWNYDAQNRLKMPPDLHVPNAWHPRENEYVSQARAYVTKYFAQNPGQIDEFKWPITHDQAQKALHDFLEHRLALFGPYQDAIDIHHDVLFHSLLSSSLNNGLLTPADVIAQTLAFAKKHRTPLNSLEGFIRQIIGWREFVRGIYLIKGKQQAQSNFFNHTNKLPQSFWNAATGIVPLDATIKKIVSSAYVHHIERLMILGNFMLLTRTNPDEVYRWFMELFIDAYDWVMVPNVYGMSQYADGGLMTTKPYFSGSNYIRKMSNYKKGDWCILWDALYWAFVYDHRVLIAKNGRLATMGMYLKRMNPETLKAHLKIASQFLKK